MLEELTNKQGQLNDFLKFVEENTQESGTKLKSVFEVLDDILDFD